MQPRNLSILVGILCLAAAAGIAFFSQDSLAVERPPGAATQPATSPEPISAGRDLDAGPVEAAYSPEDQGVPIAVVAAAEPQQRVDTSGWTKGVIRGRIQLAVSALDRLRSITVIAEEARNAFDNGNGFTRPNKLVVPVELGVGTPEFEVTGVPFSEYPYTVTAYAPGLNGGQRTVVIDEQQPLVEDVVLTITPGAPFSILLRDQDGGAHTGIDVSMQPVGAPNGRPGKAGVSDNFGSVVFEDVLAGQYRLAASLGGQPFGEAQEVTVQPGTRALSVKVQGQGHTMLIPRGTAMTVLVHDAPGYGIAGAMVSVTATDRVRLTKFETETDASGRARFTHLQPGVWQLTVEHDKCQRVDQQITLKPDQGPLERNVKLVRNRW